MIRSWKLWLGIGFGLGSDFVVVANPPDLTIKGNLPHRKVVALRSFIRDELPRERFAFKGRLGRGGTFHLEWAGNPPPLLCQRIRNVTADILT